MCDDPEQAVHRYTHGLYKYFKERGLCLSDRALGSAQGDLVTFNAGFWTRDYHVAGL